MTISLPARMPLPPNTSLVASPCVGVCRMLPDGSVCEGCGRNLDEIARWGMALAQERRAILARVAARRSGVVMAARP